MIAHDLSIVRHVSDRSRWMYLGKIVEIASLPRVHQRDAPLHHGAAVRGAGAGPEQADEAGPDPVDRRRAQPAEPPPACRFHTRCWKAQDICKTQEPPMRELEPGHEVACHFPENAPAGAAATEPATAAFLTLPDHWTRRCASRAGGPAFVLCGAQPVLGWGHAADHGRHREDDRPAVQHQCQGANAPCARKPEAAALGVLGVAASADGLRPSEIATMLGCTSPRSPGRSAGLEDAGYVSVAPDPGDRGPVSSRSPGRPAADRGADQDRAGPFPRLRRGLGREDVRALGRLWPNWTIRWKRSGTVNKRPGGRRWQR